ncbi:sugar phosphate isomerase/epimerase family protein [Paenibacillus koleovorans]|uniref:sugar phosphate isomerase/epimerase family protein n=1 Tax=Paenibacillus koleovorans TaxID=121608 RepID=UPI000FDA5FE5|nr:sugar phosphate isomerase/epimerase [Paenibacillus koleovorans]
MLYTGLLSVTFRKLSAEQIVSLVVEAGLDGIEWGGDIHVPPGDVETAKAVRVMTEQAGLKVAAYGSYYRVGTGQSFEDVLSSASALGAPVIRVWAGNKGSAAADEAWWDAVVEDTRAIGERAAQAGIRIAFEFHQNTLTDELDATLRLLKAADHPNVYSYWQALRPFESGAYAGELEALTPWLTNVHVYYISYGTRHSLEEGESVWDRYLAALPSGEDRYVMLEFVKDDAPEQFLQDAATLKRIVKRANEA